MKQIIYLIVLTFLFNCSSDNSDSSNNNGSYSDWKQYRGSNKMGFSSSSAPSETPTDIADSVDYDFYLEISSNEGVTGSPIIANGKLYITIGVIGGGENLSAFNLNNGELIWSFSLEDYILPPTINDGILYFAYSNDNEVIALNSNDGSEIWRTNVSIYSSSPTYHNGILLVDNSALDANTGEVLWQFDGSENASPNAVYTKARSYSPSVSNNLVYLSGYEQLDNFQTNKFIYAINIETGEEVWRQQIGNGSGFLSIIPISNNTLFFTTGNQLNALNATTGEEIWSLEMTNSSGIESSPAIGYNKIFIVTYNSILTSFDQNTGQQLWEFDLADIGANSNNPVVADNKVFIAGSDFLYAIDVNTGTELWKSNVYSGGLFNTEPVISGGKVIFNNGISLSILE